jgi:hypothetical protein
MKKALFVVAVMLWLTVWASFLISAMLGIVIRQVNFWHWMLS